MAEKKKSRRARETLDHKASTVDDVARLADAERDDAPAADAGADTAAVPSAEEIAEKEASTLASREALVDRLFEKSEMIAKLTAQQRELESAAKEANDKWLRSAAEFENYRKRTRKEWELLRQQTKAEVILEILNVVDDFERAFAVEEGGGSNGFVAGFRLIYNNLTQILDRMGVKELEALHKPFDPNFHMAVSQVEREDLDSGLVAEVLQKGYHLDGTVIRPATVIVAK